MLITQTTTKRAIVRVYGVGHDKEDAFEQGKELWSDWNLAKKESLAKNLDIFTTVLNIPYSDISKA